MAKEINSFRTTLSLLSIGLALVCSLIVFSLIGCSKKQPITSANSSDGLATVSLALNWIPDSQHGGFYAAKVNGLYAEAGLDVQILPGGPNAPVIQQVALQRTQFGIGNADQILMAREQEAPVVAVMAAMQNSPRCIMVHAESGITKFDELRDMKLSVGTAKAFAKFLSSKIKLENVTFVPYTGSIAPFLQDPKMGQQAYVFSEPHVAETNGKNVNTLMVSELGFNPYSSCVFVHEETLREEPDLVKNFVSATIQGWRKYLTAPAEANAAIQKDNPAMELSHLEFGAQAIKPLCLPKNAEPQTLGRMSDQRWSKLAQQLKELDFLSDATTFRDAFSLEFLP